MTQIERVAQALIDRIGSPWSWDEMDPAIRELWKGHAQAAIAAMWTPFDAEDRETWPEPGLYFTKLENGTYEKNRRTTQGWIYGPVTHYQEITGTG